MFKVYMCLGKNPIKSPQGLKLRGWEFIAARVYTAADAIPRRAKRFLYEPCKFVFA
jgi:hypothetical protein